MCLSNDLPCPEYCPPDISPQSRSRWAPARSWCNTPSCLGPAGGRGRGRWWWERWWRGAPPPPQSGPRTRCPPAARQTEAGSSSSRCGPPRCCVWPGPRTGSEAQSSVGTNQSPHSTYRLPHLPVFLCQNTRYSVFSVERFWMNIFPVHEPLDININAVRDNDICQDSVTMKQNLGLEAVRRLSQHGTRHLDCN